MLAVNTGEVAFPDASVTAVAVFDPPANVPLAPPAGAVNVTVAPLTALPLASFTVATSCDMNAISTCALWGVPEFAVIDAAGPARLVSAKLAGVAVFGAEAVTVKLPLSAFAVKAAATATPEALVCAVVIAPSPAKVPLGPLEGAINVTVTPLTGLPFESVTVADSAVANCVVTAALCGVPPVAAIVPSGAGVFVSEKLAVPATPLTEAAAMKLPMVPLAVSAGEVALPEASVTAVAVFVPPAKLPLAPLAGAVNVTVTPLTGLPPASFTAATNGAP